MDHPTRLLQRRRDAGDPQAGEALLRARIRAGQVRVQRIALLALCGHELARELTGTPLAPGYRQWKRAARGAGKRAALEAAAAASRVALPTTPALEELLCCVDAWCAAPRREAQDAIVAAHRAALERCREELARAGQLDAACLAGVLLNRKADASSVVARLVLALLRRTPGRDELLAAMREVLEARTLIP